MAPIRKYLRITKYSVLEVRIYLDKPSDAPWLLSTRDPVLQRIMAAIRPKVLPKLREENENARKKIGKKKKGIKDVVTRQDFEVIIFLKDLSTRHALLTKQKRFANKAPIRSTSSKLTGWLNEGDSDSTRILQEDNDDDDDVVELHSIPAATTANTADRSDVDADGLFVNSDEEEGAHEPANELTSTRRRRDGVDIADGEDDKKKMALDTSYDGFSIYGRTLCLVVKRKGQKAAPAESSAHTGGSQMMENWVSTQAAQDGGMLHDDD